MRIEILLRRAQPGTRGGVAAHIRRAERLHRLIAERFGVDEPYPYRAKHLRYALEHGTAGLASASRYDYYRTARALAAVLGHWPDWEPHLRGPWTSPLSEASRRRPDRARAGRGGRPAKLARERSRQPRTTPGRE